MLGGGEELNNVVSIPVGGGPIYVGDMVGPLTTVPHFETCAFQQLESLKQEILYAGETVSICDDEEDISVDELKIIGEDEFVRKAFEEAFKDDDQSANPRTTTTTTGDDNGKKPNKKPSGGKRNNKWMLHTEKNNNPFNESYIAKVEELAKLKQKQEEDKATVRLHSFNSRVSKPDTITSQLKSASCVATKVVRASSSTSNNLPVHFPEVVLSLEVYHHSKTRLKTQEFLVLGRQFLTEVRDKIHCVTDEMMKKAGQYDPSGYFFIEDVFCNDTRDPTAIDYSKPILDWLKNSKDDALEKWDELQHEQKGLLPELKSVQMQKTRFCDITFRLGAGYVYCHQGDCKHVIVIRDMRLIHPEDVQNRAAYPLITYQLKLRYKKCSVCNIYRAKKMTVDDKWASLNPCYFCDVCYYMLHYGNGSLLYSDFAVYDYHHE